jgi:predicted Zn-dependent peptidase
MLEHMAFKGTKNRNAETIAREIEDVGGDINAYTSKEVTAYYLKVLHENTKLGVDILSDIIKNSTLPKDEIER